MYIPEAFRVDDPEVLHALIRSHPLGTVITSGIGGLQAAPLPFLFDAAEGRHGTLRAHLARANPLIDALRGCAECLVLFHGPQGYVSPSWYPSKQQHHKVAPTWNYAMVQARGRATVIDDAAWLREQIAALTAEHEAHRDAPWSPADAPADFIAGMIAGIAGIEIAIEALDGKFKLSQNRGRADRDGVIEALGSPDDPHRHPELATLMQGLTR